MTTQPAIGGHQVRLMNRFEKVRVCVKSGWTCPYHQEVQRKVIIGSTTGSDGLTRPVVSKQIVGWRCGMGSAPDVCPRARSIEIMRSEDRIGVEEKLFPQINFSSKSQAKMDRAIRQVRHIEGVLANPALMASLDQPQIDSLHNTLNDLKKVIR